MFWHSRFFLKMDEKNDDKGGGGGTPPPDSKDDVIAALTKRLEALEGKKSDPPEDPDHYKKVQKDRESKDQKDRESKQLESALRFSLGSKDWLKTNASLLPKDIADVFTVADKETFDNAVEKDAAIKSGIIQQFFSIQDNVNLLTPSLKSGLEDYLKLTKTGKQERAQQVYDSIFEPAFEMLKRVKKAEQLNGPHANKTDSEKAYGEKLMKLSKKHYMGEKQDA